MSATVIDTNSEAFSSGLTRETLRRARWADVIELRGLARAGVIKDLGRYDIRPEVRLNAAAFARFRPGATEFDPELGAVGDYRLTTEWQSVRPDFAFSLWFRSQEEVPLGARTVAMTAMDDGLGGRFWNPGAVAGEPDLFEYRLPAEIPTIATSVVVLKEDK